MKKIIVTCMAACALLWSACNSNSKSTEAKDTTAMAANDTVNQGKYHYNMQWEAFKTPAKKGVKGSFTQIKLEGTQDTATHFTGILEGAQFSINVMSVSSGDATRDTNLKDNFFSKLNGDISGKFGKFANGKVPVTLTLAGVTQQINLNYEDMGDSLKVKGTIDLLKDFKANAAFESIAKACSVWHEGKTWTDVNISGKISK